MSPLQDKLLEKYNQSLDARALLDNLDLEFEEDGANPSLLVCTCPFHGDGNAKTLRVDAAKKNYQCLEKSCVVASGGDLIHLFSQMRSLSREDAGLQIFNTLGMQITEENRVFKRNLYIAFSEKLTTEDLTQAAKNMLLIAYQEFPDNLVIISRLINIYTREGDNEKACDYLLKAATIVAENKNYHSARTALNRLFSIDPHNERARDLLARIIAAEWDDFYKSPTAPQGESSLFESIAGVPLTPSLRVRLTLILLEFQRRKMLQDLYAEFPDDLDDEQKIHLQEVAGKLAKGIHKLTNPVDAFLLLADILLKLGNHESAREALQDALKAIEDGASDERRGEVEKRLRDFEDVLLRKEYEYALVLMQTGNYEAALKNFENALDTTEINPDLADKLIHCHFKLEQYGEAARICTILAELHNLQKRHVEAALILNRALLFKPGDRDLIIKLIETYKRLGNNDLAEEVAELTSRQIIIEPASLYDDESRGSQRPARTIPQIPEPKVYPSSLPSAAPQSWRDTPTSRISVERPAAQSHVTTPATPQRTPARPVEAPAAARVPAPSASATGFPAVSTQSPAKEYAVQIPLKLSLYTSSASTDKITPFEATAITISSDMMVVNCGAITLPGIQPASINYILQNCQVAALVTLRSNEDPVRLFGRITKVQNQRIRKHFIKVLTIELQESDYPGKKKYDQYMQQLALTPPVSSSTEDSEDEDSDKSDLPEVSEGRIFKELLVSTRFLDEAGDEKTPDFFYANTLSIGENELALNFGELRISGVPEHSMNYFLRNCTLELTIPLPEPNQTVRLFTQVKSVRNRVIRGKKSKILTVETIESPARDTRIFNDYIRSYMN